MRVDVILPVFEGERFVRRAVESALTQRLPADLGLTVTVRCIDDGSTDGSWRVLGELADLYPEVCASRNSQRRRSRQERPRSRTSTPRSWPWPATTQVRGSGPR